MTTEGCAHLLEFKASKGIQPFKVVFQAFVFCANKVARQRKVSLIMEAAASADCEEFTPNIVFSFSLT